MELIGLTKAIALTTLTFTLSATPTWSQTNQNQALTIKNFQVVSQRPPILYSQSRSNRALAQTYYNRGVDYYEQGNLDLALFNYTQAIKLNPNHADAYNNRGVVYENQQKWDLALADYTQAIRINPDYALAYNNRGLVYENQEKWDLALADYNQAITIDPNYAEAYILRGRVYRDQEKWDLALTDFTRAIRINPSDALGYLGRGTVYLQLRDINKAREDLQIAAQLFRNEGDTSAYQETIEVITLLNSL